MENDDGEGDGVEKDDGGGGGCCDGDIDVVENEDDDDDELTKFICCMYKNYYSEINVSADVYMLIDDLLLCSIMLIKMEQITKYHTNYKLHFSVISLEFGCSFRYLEIQYYY